MKSVTRNPQKTTKQICNKLQKMQVSLRKKNLEQKIKSKRQIQEAPSMYVDFEDTSSSTPGQSPPQSRIYELLMQQPVQKQKFTNLVEPTNVSNIPLWLSQNYECAAEDISFAFCLIQSPSIFQKQAGLWCLAMLIKKRKIHAQLLFTREFACNFVNQLAQQSGLVLQGYIEVISSIIAHESGQTIQILMDSQYPQIVVELLKQCQPQIMQALLWQVGLLCSEDNETYCFKFLNLKIVSVILQLKQQMGVKAWSDCQHELGPMYCYVMNSFTWDFHSYGDLDSEIAQELQPCIPFLQDQAIFYLESKDGTDEDLVAICEIFTTIEAIISIGMHCNQESIFMQHPMIEQLLRLSFRLLQEQFNQYHYLSTIQNLCAYDISKEIIVQSINLIQCVLESESVAASMMVQAGIVALMHQAVVACQDSTSSRDEILYGVLDVVAKLCDSDDSFPWVVNHPQLLEKLFSLALDHHKTWSSSLNLSLTNIVRNIAELVQEESHFLYLTKIRMPLLMLQLLALYQNRSDSIVQGILMSFESIISMSYDVPEFMQQCQTFESSDGESLSEILDNLTQSNNEHVKALAFDCQSLYCEDYSYDMDLAQLII